MKKSLRTAVILTAGLLAMAPCAAGFTAYAGATDSYTISVSETADGYKYSAYQIFAGNISTKGEGENAEKILSDITWGVGFKGDDFIAAL